MSRIDIDARVDRIQLPENQRLRYLLTEHQQSCTAAGCREPFFLFGGTESPFPLPGPVISGLRQQDPDGRLSDPAGLPELRKAVSAFHSHHYQVMADPERIVIGHGVKGLLFPVFTLLGGSVIVPSPGWLGYLPQLRMLNKPYYRLYGNRSTNYKIRAPSLRALLKGLVKTQHLLLLNNPGYPSGILYTEPELREIADICREYSTLILANETGGLLTYDPSRFISMGRIYPEGTFIINSLSLDRSAAGVRIATCILPEGSDRKVLLELIKILDTVYAAAATPMQQAAITAYLPGPEMDAWIRDTREIHRIMTTHLAEGFAAIEGIRVIIPDGGFSFLVDLNPLASRLGEAGIIYSNDLAPALIQHPYHIATVAGEAMMAAYAEFYMKIAATDYDARSALEAYRRSSPGGDEEEAAFFARFGSRMIRGKEMFEEWITDLKEGRVHVQREM